METIHAHGTPLAAYLEGDGQLGDDDPRPSAPIASVTYPPQTSFAPTAWHPAYSTFVKQLPHSLAATHQRSPSSLSRVHHAWSRAVNSRLGRADNARFIEHFRYTIVASQLLNEYIDHGVRPPSAPSNLSRDGNANGLSVPTVTTSLFGAALTATFAFALVYLVHWTRNGGDGSLSKGRIIFGLLMFLALALIGYAYLRRRWLQFLRRNAVAEVGSLTAAWQAFETTTSSALSLVQEVELVSRGYRLSTPLPPASRIEDPGVGRRCLRLRKALHAAYTAVEAACTNALSTLGTLVHESDLEKYFEVYDISHVDARDALEGVEAALEFAADCESLKHLRVLSYRTNLLRRVMLCSLMALEADGGKPDFSRWRSATDAMHLVSNAVSQAVERIQQCLKDMEAMGTSPSPTTTSTKPPIPATKDKLRSQTRKISMLSSGIKTLQAKMQILREESARSIEQTEDPAELGPSLVSQYDSIGEDIRELMRSWEAGKASLQSNLIKQDRHISLASSGARSTTSSSIGGLTAVDEDGSPAAALKILSGDSSLSNRSSMATTPSDEEVFEAIALPRQRSTLTREERLVKMQEERERQALLRAQRDENTSMLRELESVINLRPKKGKDGVQVRVTSI